MEKPKTTNKLNRTRIITVVIIIIALMCLCCSLFSVFIFSRASNDLANLHKANDLFERMCKNQSNPELKDLYDHYTTGKFKDNFALKTFRELYINFPEVMEGCKQTIEKLSVSDVIRGNVVVKSYESEERETLNIVIRTQTNTQVIIIKELNGSWKLEDIQINEL